MTKPVFPERAEIVASNSELFPVVAGIRLDRAHPDRPRVKFLVKRPGQAEKELFQADLPEVTIPGAAVTVRGTFPDSDQRYLAVVTLCPGKEPETLPRYVCGLLYNADPGIDEGAIGVWVAEEKPPKGPPGSEE